NFKVVADNSKEAAASFRVAAPSFEGVERSSKVEEPSSKVAANSKGARAWGRERGCKAGKERVARAFGRSLVRAAMLRELRLVREDLGVAREVLAAGDGGLAAKAGLAAVSVKAADSAVVLARAKIPILPRSSPLPSWKSSRVSSRATAT